MSEKEIKDRRFPGYERYAKEWRFFYLSYIGGYEYTASNLFKFEREGKDEFTKRQQRAARENHSKNIVDIIVSYLFKEEAIRNPPEGQNQLLSEFINNADGQGNSMHAFQKVTARWGDSMGRIYIVEDRPQIDGMYLNNMDPSNMPYCYHVFPQNVIDVAYDDSARVKWALIEEKFREDDSFETASDELGSRYRLWTPDGWRLYDDSGTVILENMELGFEYTPITYYDPVPQDLYTGGSSLEDVAYLDRAIFNNKSRLDVVLAEQTFSQLIMPIQAQLLQQFAGSRDIDVRQLMQTLSANRVLTYDGSASQKPEWISPDPEQGKLLLQAINEDTARLYATLGLTGEIGTEVKSQSGTAKAWDFDKLNRKLSTRANQLEQVEKHLYEFFGQWLETDINIDLEYPRRFDLRTLDQEIEEAERLLNLGMPVEFEREVMKRLVGKALPRLSGIDKDRIMGILDTFNPMEPAAQPPIF